MKYTITWKDIFLDYLIRFGLKGMPVYVFGTFCVFWLLQFFAGVSHQYSFLQYVLIFFKNIHIVLLMYAGAILTLVGISYRYTKNNIIGEHEIYIERPYFIWKSKRQEIKTQLSLFQDFTVTSKYMLLKFQGLKKAKIKKSWITQGEKEFISDMSPFIHETEHQKNH